MKSGRKQARRLRPRRLKRTVFFGASTAVFCALALLVYEVKRVPPRAGDRAQGKAETDPLTDVAGRTTSIVLPSMPHGTGAPPGYKVDETGQQVALPADYVLPHDVSDPTNPPAGTAPLALPGDPDPPDPGLPPKIVQDPERGGRTQPLQ